MLRQSFAPGDRLPFRCHQQPSAAHFLYDLDLDPDATENRLVGADERVRLEWLHAALTEIEALAEQFRRLGIS